MSIYDLGLFAIYYGVLAFLLGAAMGSFLNCAAWRIAHGESFLKGRSRCPSCGHTLGVLDLFPVFSWLFLRGKCRYCREKIPARYLVTELFFGALTVAVLFRFDFTVTALRNFIFICCLFCLSLVDLDIYEIPNGCVIISALAWLAAVPFGERPLHTLWTGALTGVVLGGGMLIISLILDKILKKDSMGGGDIKLFAVCGLYMGAFGSLFMLILSCVMGLLFAAVRRLRSGEGGQIPFGPSIAAAACVMLFFGDPLVNWYLGLLSNI